MALLFCDSFDHYSTAQIAQKWSAAVTGTISAGGGRFGTNGWLASINSNTATLTWIAPSAFQTWIVGAAITINSFGGVSTWRGLYIADGSTVQIDLFWDSVNQKFIVRRGGSTTILTSTRTIVPDVTYYVEIKVTIDNAGSLELWIDGVLDGTFSGDTQQSANATADRCGTTGSNGGLGNTLQWRLDDFYVCDTTGSVANDVLKDPRIECVFPNGNGNSSQLVGSDGNSTDNYLLVDESTPNDDTDYVQSATAGDKDTYTYGDLPTTSGTVAGVQINTRARKTDAGARSIVSVARLSGTEVDSAVEVLGTGYTYFPDARSTKPGGGAWTISDVNNAEFGVKVNA